MTSAAPSSGDTPLMQQYREIKARHRDAILLFRMGDFYEMFYEDAETGSRALGLTLTARNNGAAANVPLAGVPVKALGDYVQRLIRLGFRVAVCDQVEDPKDAKGVVRREVVETITPGAAFADELLDGGRNNFLCAIAPPPHAPPGTLGIAAADLSTGELRLTTVPAADAGSVLARLAPRELLVPRGTSDPAAALGDGALVTEREGWEFDAAHAGDDLARQFGVTSLEGLGFGADDSASLAAAGALLRYLRELQPGGVPHLARPIIERPDGLMPLDEMTRRNLELVESLRGGTEGTLLDVLDRTCTPMGARLLRLWVLSPLTTRARIEERLDRVSALAADSLARSALRMALDGVRDLERLAGKVVARRATPRELRALGNSLAALPAVEAAVSRVLGGLRGDEEVHQGAPPDGGAALASLMASWDPCDDVAAPILRTLTERPPTAVGDDPTIAPGVDDTLDQWRELRDGGKDKIAAMQAAERERTGINSLKVGYNRVFGYYIEVSNTHRHAIPSDYQRRQTLTGAERYVTPDLKAYEERVLAAAEQIDARERELFETLRAATGGSATRIQQAARLVAQLDVLASLAEVAVRERYVRPVLSDGFALEILAGRHPVVERMMPREQFIPNDVSLAAGARVIILTGPNMAGKSTILRQIGLIVLLAQIGQLRAGGRSEPGRRGPTVHARRSERQSGARSVHLHGRDVGDQRDPAHGDRQESGPARRDRPWHLDVRRCLDRLGGHRASARGRGLQDGVRDPLSRAHPTGGRARGGPQFQRRGPRGRGARPLPAPHGTRRRRSFVRDRSGTAGGTPRTRALTSPRGSAHARGGAMGRRTRRPSPPHGIRRRGRDVEPARSAPALPRPAPSGRRPTRRHQPRHDHTARRPDPTRVAGAPSKEVAVRSSLVLAVRQ